MKIVLWIGNDPNQYALACKLESQFEILGIVLETKQSKKTKFSFTRFFNKVVVRLFYNWIPKTWETLMDDYQKKYPNLPNTKILNVSSINDPKCKSFTESLQPDLIVVSGTYLVKTENLQTNSQSGMVNLHTGLSPYIKGGPNCTNWCLSIGKFELIGNSIMWIDQGIDSGNLILTEQTKFDGSESFFEVHLKVMNHAHDLYARAIKEIQKGSAKNIKQGSIATGTTFYTKDWNWKANHNLRKNLTKFKSEFDKKEITPIIVN